MRELSEVETQNLGGGFWPIVLRIVIPTIVNIGVYAFNKHKHEEEITPTGLSIAIGSGVVSGGIGAAAGAAAGGGLVGAAVWAPGTAAINASGNLIAQEH